VIRLPFAVEFEAVKNQVEALLKPHDGRIVID